MLDKVDAQARCLLNAVTASTPGSHMASHAWLIVNHQSHKVSGKGLVPLSPDAPVGEPSLAQPGQEGVVCHPGYQLEVLEQGILGNVVRQRWVIQNFAISICARTCTQ